jgi:hypothetical protein
MKRLALIALIALIACGKPEPEGIAPPVPTQEIDAGSSPATAVVRTVSYRNPFGDAVHPDNLMLDGDFEFTGRSGQTPWIAASGTGAPINIDYETGGRCRSGVRCARMQGGSILLGHVATPPAGKIYLRIWGKPDSGKCSELSVAFFDSTNNQSAGTAPAQTPAPDETGWCLYEAVLASLPLHEPLLYLKSKEQAVTVDAAVALPTNGPKPLLAGPPLSKTDEALAGRIAAAMRQRGEPTRPPPMDPPRFLPPGAM